jgi:hypothetical protein
MTTARRTWIVVASLSLAGLAASSAATGCKKGNKEGAGSAKTAETAEGGGGGGGALGLYVHCLNEADKTVHASWNSYTRWVDKAGPTGTEKSIDGINQINDYDTKVCLENLTKALAEGPPAALVEPTKAYQATLTALLPIVDETKTYYEHKDYKDDAFAKGKELHGKLVAAFDAWKAANTAMRDQWDTAHRAQRDKDLAKTEKEHGRKSELFVTAFVMNSAEQMIETVTTSDDPATVKAAFAAYATAFDELNGFFGPALTASTDTDRYMFKQSADALLTQTKEARRALDAGKALPEENDGSKDALIDKYNALVETSNDITW